MNKCYILLTLALMLLLTEKTLQTGSRIFRRSVSEEKFKRDIGNGSAMDTVDIEAQERAQPVGEVPKPAGCTTLETIVSLRPESVTDPRLIYSPSCTTVHRCGGSCMSKGLSCKPTSTRLRTFSVNVLEYVSGTKTRFKSREMIEIEEHVDCACQNQVKIDHGSSEGELSEDFDHSKELNTTNADPEVDHAHSANEVPKPAGCKTRATVVNLEPENSTDSRLIYSPSSTIVQRCSGCCVSKRLSCEPTSTQLRTFSVNVLEYASGTKIHIKARDMVVIEEHMSCACQGRIKESDCNSLQRYISRSVRCECMNLDDRNKCLQQSDIKQWDPETCSCQCLAETGCSEGS